MPEPRSAFADLAKKLEERQKKIDKLLQDLTMHTHDKHPMLGDTGPFCKCMACARERDLRWQREYQQVLTDLSANPGDPAQVPETLIQDANAQKVVRQITREIEEILTEYDEMDTITGTKINDLLRGYWRVS